MSVHHTQSPARLKEASTTDDHTAVRTNPLPFNVRAGKPKGYPIELVRGHRSMSSPLPGMQTMTNVSGVPVADAPEPLDPTLAGKHEPPVMIHPSMTKAQVAAACCNGEDILREALGGTGRHGLPVKTAEG
jgi:hypothetical protein